MIALLPLKYPQLRARFGWSLSNLAALLRQPTVRLSRPVRMDRPALSATATTRPRRRADPAFLVKQLGQQNCQPQLLTSAEPRSAPIFFTPQPRFRLIWTAVREANLCSAFQSNKWVFPNGRSPLLILTLAGYGDRHVGRLPRLQVSNCHLAGGGYVAPIDAAIAPAAVLRNE